MRQANDAQRHRALGRGGLERRRGHGRRPVARTSRSRSRLLPRRASASSCSRVYGYARFVDEIGDLAGCPGDRLPRTTGLGREPNSTVLSRGRPTHPVFVAVGETARELGIDRSPFVDLIEANRLDQRRLRYATFDELEAYCALSANPVGRLVLAIFGCSRPHSRSSSRTMSAPGLQLVEHWQDVAEDLAAGRIYMPRRGSRRASVSRGPISPARARLASPPDGLRGRPRAARSSRSERPLLPRLSARARRRRFHRWRARAARRDRATRLRRLVGAGKGAKSARWPSRAASLSVARRADPA